MAGQYILVVEDEDLVQMLLATYLEDLGFEVTLASSAAQARDKIRLLGSVVVGAVIDMSLPDGQGDTLLRELRSIHPNLAAIMASGYEPASFRARLSGETAIEYLKKPFSREQLDAALRSVGVSP